MTNTFSATHAFGGQDPGTMLDSMLDTGSYASAYPGGAAPTLGLPHAQLPPMASMCDPLSFLGAGTHQGVFSTQPPGDADLSTLSEGDLAFSGAQLPVRSISDPTRQTSGAAAQRQPWATHQQLQDIGRFSPAAAALPPLPPPAYSAATGSGGSSQGPEVYSAYLNAAGQQYQDVPFLGPGMAPLGAQGYGLALGGGGLTNVGTSWTSSNALQQLPGYSHGPQHTSLMLGAAPYGNNSAQAVDRRSAVPDQLVAPPAHAYAPLPGDLDSWSNPAKAPQQQQQQQQQQQALRQQYMQVAAFALPDSNVRSQLWPHAMGHDRLSSLDAAPSNLASMSGSSGGKALHDSATGQALRPDHGPWRSPLDDVQAAHGIRLPPPDASLDAKTLGGPPLDLFAPAPGLPPLPIPPQDALLPAAAEQRWQPQQQQQQQHGLQQQQHKPQRQPEAASAEHAQQRLGVQTGRPPPQPRGRRKANLSALSRPASAGGLPMAPPPTARGGGLGGGPAASAAAPAGGGVGALGDEAAAKALRRHTLLREKNRRAQANARRREKERMSESDATIQELADRVRALEVDTSDLAAKNALLEKVAELKQEAASPRDSGSGVSDMQDDSAEQRQREIRLWQTRTAEMLTCLWGRDDNPVTVEETETMDALELLNLAEELKKQLAQQLEAGGRDPDTLAGRRLHQLIRHKRIMRPARLIWAWHRGDNPADIPKMWVWKPRKPGAIDPANCDDLRDRQEASLGPRTPELWRRIMAAMELGPEQRAAMLAARRRLLADMGALMRQRERVVGLLAAAADMQPGELSFDALACDGPAQATQAAEELRGNLDAERDAVIAYWEAVHEGTLAPWQEAAGVVAAWPHAIDSLAFCNMLAAEAGEGAAPDGFDISALPRDSPFRRFLAVTDDSSSGGDSMDVRRQPGAEQGQDSTLQQLAAKQEPNGSPISVSVPGPQR